MLSALAWGFHLVLIGRFVGPSSQAPFAAVFGAFVLTERISWVGGVGCCLIFAAMLAVELVPSTRSGGNKPADVELNVLTG